jgi:hypothetical protein
VIGMPEPAVFYYDLNSPYAWLAAERINSVLAEPPVWRPISYSHVIQHTGVTPWSVKPGREKQMEEIERRAEERGLPPIRWPEGWPVETVPLTGLRAATFTAELGEVVAFTLCAWAASSPRSCRASPRSTACSPSWSCKRRGCERALAHAPSPCCSTIRIEPAGTTCSYSADWRNSCAPRN